MANCIVYKLPDNRVCVVYPAVWKDVPEDALEAQEIDVDSLPADRSRRNDWQLVGGEVIVPD